MDSHAVFVGLAGLQINCAAAYPAEIQVLEMGLVHVMPPLQGPTANVTARGHIVRMSKDVCAPLRGKAPNCATSTKSNFLVLQKTTVYSWLH